MLTKRISAPAAFKAEAEGSLSAVFSTFGIVDSDGDILTAEAFTDGQPAPMVWSHDWSMPIGKGVIKVEPERAIFNGQLWLDTIDGEQAYRKIKNAGPLQEFSWGFRILDAEPGEKDGEPVRYITKAELFEVSPVLIGANRETYTLAIKGRRRLSRGQLEAVITTLQALLGEAIAAEVPADADAGKATEVPAALTLAATGEHLAAELAAFTAALKGAGITERADARAWAGDIAQRLTATRQALDAVLRRADEEAELDTGSLFRALDMLDVRYGALGGGLVR